MNGAQTQNTNLDGRYNYQQKQKDYNQKMMQQ